MSEKNGFVGRHLLQYILERDETGNHQRTFLLPLLAARAAIILVERVPATTAVQFLQFQSLNQF